MLGKKKRGRPSKAETTQSDSLVSPLNAEQDSETKSKTKPRKSEINQYNEIKNNEKKPRRGRSKKTIEIQEDEVKKKPKNIPAPVENHNGLNDEHRKKGRPRKLTFKSNLHDYIKQKSTKKDKKLTKDLNLELNESNTQEELKTRRKKSNIEETLENGNNDNEFKTIKRLNTQLPNTCKGKKRRRPKNSNSDVEIQENGIEPDEPEFKIKHRVSKKIVKNEELEVLNIHKKRRNPIKDSVKEENSNEPNKSEFKRKTRVSKDIVDNEKHEELPEESETQDKCTTPKRDSINESNSLETHENINDQPEFTTKYRVSKKIVENKELEELNIHKKRRNSIKDSVKEGNSNEPNKSEFKRKTRVSKDIVDNEKHEELPEESETQDKCTTPKRDSINESNSLETHENINDQPEFKTKYRVSKKIVENKELEELNIHKKRRNSIKDSVKEENSNEPNKSEFKRKTRVSKDIVDNEKHEELPEESETQDKCTTPKRDSVKEENSNEPNKSEFKRKTRVSKDIVDNEKHEELPEASETQDKRTTPKRDSINESNSLETHENINDQPEFHKTQELPKKKGRPRIHPIKEKRDNEESKGKCKGRERKSFSRYSNNYDDTLRNYKERIDFLTKVPDKNMIVECDVCHESMTVVKYQKSHMAVHNYLCWLKGEEPLDLKNEIILERILNRAKMYNKKAIFKCPVCDKPNKSGRGYLSHIQFCGKTDEEKMSVMSPCELCGKLLMPASIDSHIYHLHNLNKKQEATLEITGTRKAAENCLKTMSVLTEGNKKSTLEIDSNDEFTEFYTEIKILKKDYIDGWTKAFLNDETVNCPCTNCDFKTERMTELQKHFKLCSAKSKKFQCLECEFLTENEQEVISHIKILHAFRVQVARNKSKGLEKNTETVSGLPYIPFLKYAEQTSKPIINSLNKFFVRALTWTKEQHALHYSKEKLFPSLSLEMDEWKFKNENEVKEYIQHTERSLRIKFKNDWFTLKRYEASIQDNLAVIFCGGPVFGLAWAPGTGRQFLAIGAHLSMTDFYQVSSTCAGPGNIQIWSFGNMDNKQNSQVEDAKLEYLICHESRGAWSLDWCPSGCRDERMGLLAVGTASGSVIIFSIPMPNTENSSFPACKPKPILNLEISPNERYHCTKVSWSKVKPHNTIVGGFANGYVAVWEIDTESFLLKKGRTIYPYKIFQAHHSIITGLTFSPMSNTFIVTSGYDKMIKYWDLTDTTAPVSKNSRHLVTDVSWLLHWMTCGYSIDNICSGGETTMCFNSVRDIVYELHTFVTGIKALAMSISANDWLNGSVLAHDNGQINLVFGGKQPQINSDERKKFIKVIIEPNLYDFNNEKYLKRPSKNDELYDINDSIEYEDTVNKYGLHFKTNFNLGFNDTLHGNQPNPINIYPIITANKVAWNPNISSFLNMAVGYQNGLVILPKMILSGCDQLRVDELDN